MDLGHLIVTEVYGKVLQHIHMPMISLIKRYCLCKSLFKWIFFFKNLYITSIMFHSTVETYQYSFNHLYIY